MEPGSWTLPPGEGGRACGVTSPRGCPWTASPPTSSPGRGRLAQRLKEDLRRSSPKGKKLQELKAQIFRQRQEYLLRDHGEGAGPPHAHRLKRKVCKVGFASASAGLHPGRECKTVKKQPQQPSSSPCPLREKAQKEKAVHLFGASAWRRGQRLAREILGPRCKCPEWDRGAEKAADGIGTEPGPALVSKGHLGDTSEGQRAPGPRGNLQAWQRPVTRAEQGGNMVELNQMTRDRNSSKKVRLEKPPNRGKWPRRPQTSSQENAGAPCDQDGPKPGRSPGARDAVSLGGPLQERGRPFAKAQGQGRRPSPGNATPHREGQPSKAQRRSPYSPEEVREFMSKKIAERKRKRQEEQKSLTQEREARNRRLQEVYRRQKEACRRGKVGTGAQPCPRGDTGTGTAPGNRGPTHRDGPHRDPEGMDRIRQASLALLRSEMEEGSHVPPDGRWPLPLPLDRDEGCPLTLTDLGLPPSPVAKPSGSPEQSPLAGGERAAPWDTWGASLYRGKRERVRAVHALARDLGERLEKEMDQLQGRRWAAESWHRGLGSGLPKRPWSISKSEGQAGGPGEAGCTGRLSPHAPEIRKVPEEAAAQDAKERIWSLLSAARSGHPGSQRAPSPEERRHGSHRSETQNVSSKGHPEGDGLQKAKGLSPSSPRSPQGFSHRKPLLLASSLEPEFCTTLQQSPGGDSSREKQPGLPEARHGGSFHQGQGAPDRPSSSTPTPPGRAAATDDSSSEPADSHSQWSHLGPFYGGSSTFHRFGLTMAQQCLREEELRARHQSALLRLREKALQERARAELAWLELEERCQESLQDPTRPDPTEKQAMLLTRLKQEQAEILHLQNVFRAAHRERKLLLRQQKELLETRRSTEHLWRQVLRRTGRTWPQDVAEPFDLEEGLRLEKQENRIPHPVAPCSVRPTVRRHPDPEEELHPGSNEELLQGKLKTQEWEPWLGWQESGLLQRSVEHLPSSPKQPLEVRDLEATDRAVNIEEEQKGGRLVTSSLESGCLSPRRHFTTPLHSMHWEGPCLDSGDPRIAPEFQKAQAVLVNISGSSSASDVDDGQDTDISLPEEFAFLEEEPTGCGGAAVVPIAKHVGSIPSSSQGGHRRASSAPPNPDNILVTCHKEAITGRSLSGSEAFILSSQGSPRPCCPWEEEGPPAQVSPSTRNTVSSEALGQGAETGGINPKTVEAEAEFEHAFSTSADAQGPAWATDTAEGGGEDVSCFESNPGPVPCAPEASVDSVNEQSQRATPGGPLDSSQGPSVLEGTLHESECSSDENIPQRLGGTIMESTEVSTGYDKAGVSSPSPKAIDRSEEDRANLSTSAQKPTESTLEAVQPGSPKAERFIQVQSGLQEDPKDTGFLGEDLSPEMEDDTLTPVDDILLLGMADTILSPVDEAFLSHGSTTLLSSTEKEASFQSEELPDPPDILGGEGDESSFSLEDFPPPPEQLMFPETEDLDEDASVETHSLPSFSAESRPGTHLLPAAPIADEPSGHLSKS